MLWAVKFGKQINELIGNDNNLDWQSITTMDLNNNNDLQMKCISCKTRNNILFFIKKANLHLNFENHEGCLHQDFSDKDFQV